MVEDQPDFPDELEHVWRAFTRLSGARQPGFSGPSPITYEGIQAFMDVTGEPLDPWEVDVIKVLDAEFIRASKASQR